MFEITTVHLTNFINFLNFPLTQFYSNISVGMLNISRITMQNNFWHCSRLTTSFPTVDLDLQQMYVKLCQACKSQNTNLEDMWTPLQHSFSLFQLSNKQYVITAVQRLDTPKQQLEECYSSLLGDSQRTNELSG
jgi:hypothetical protein